ncbi:alpha/beta fold hydrolase [Pandoraea sp. CB10b_02]|uniref:alpha/beta hydrolase n=1 Tax=Pandoraea sp. CB10b_02 TaxID=2014535 RepID=UPI00338DE321
MCGRPMQSQFVSHGSEMSMPGVLMIHGLGGTISDFGPLRSCLEAEGFCVETVTLPGHGGSPEDLLGISVADWTDAVRLSYLTMKQRHDVVHVVGMCMGALLAVEVVKNEGHLSGGLVMLAPPMFIDGWSLPWYKVVRHLAYLIPSLARRIKVRESAPYGVKNEKIRSIVRARLKRGDAFHYSWIPLKSLREFDSLRVRARRNLHQVRCSTLVVYARYDELTSPRSAALLMRKIGGGQQACNVRVVQLENSYHMICVDNDRDHVVNSVIEFLSSMSSASR